MEVAFSKGFIRNPERTLNLFLALANYVADTNDKREEYIEVSS